MEIKEFQTALKTLFGDKEFLAALKEKQKPGVIEKIFHVHSSVKGGVVHSFRFTITGMDRLEEIKKDENWFKKFHENVLKMGVRFPREVRLPNSSYHLHITRDKYYTVSLKKI